MRSWSTAYCDEDVEQKSSPSRDTAVFSSFSSFLCLSPLLPHHLLFLHWFLHSVTLNSLTSQVHSLFYILFNSLWLLPLWTAFLIHLTLSFFLALIFFSSCNHCSIEFLFWSTFIEAFHLFFFPAHTLLLHSQSIFCCTFHLTWNPTRLNGQQDKQFTTNQQTSPANNKEGQISVLIILIYHVYYITTQLEAQDRTLSRYTAKPPAWWGYKRK